MSDMDRYFKAGVKAGLKDLYEEFKSLDPERFKKLLEKIYKNQTGESIEF